MFLSPDICSQVLRHLQNWEDCENLASVCRSVRACCLSEIRCTPPFTVYVNQPKPITAIKSSTARSLVLSFSANVGSETVLVSGAEVVSLVSLFVRLQKLTIEVLFSRKVIKLLVESVSLYQPSIELCVPVLDVAFYHKLLYHKWANFQNVVLSTTSVT